MTNSDNQSIPATPTTGTGGVKRVNIAEIHCAGAEYAPCSRNGSA